MPETTPRPKDTANTFTQNLYRFLYCRSPVRSHSNSSRASQLASPMVKAGKMMWKETVNANWIRERNSASKCMVVFYLPITSRASSRLIQREHDPEHDPESRTRQCEISP